MQRQYVKSIVEDGISEEFFDILWTKDELKFSPIVNIPDTIFFKQGLPTRWYFTSIEGRIKRKNRQNLINIQIEEVFTKKSLGYDIIATFINIPIDNDEENGIIKPCTVEYLTKEDLLKLLSTKDKDKNGILQRFIYPKGTKNDVIQVIWSPRVCLIERLENIYNLHDQRYGIYERCCTYEGPEYFYTAVPLKGPVLTGQIQGICESIATHFTEVTNGLKQLSRAIFTFKVDSKDKVWLLYTTSIRCRTNLHNSTIFLDSNPSIQLDDTEINEKQLVNMNSILQLPNNIILNPLKSIEKPIIKYPTKCLSCSSDHYDEQRYPITYKIIVKHYEHVLQFTKELYQLNSNDSSIKSDQNQKLYTDNNESFYWPPSKEVLNITGGIGFGCLDILQSDDTNKNHIITSNMLLNDYKIPILIHFLHPKMNLKTYNECYNDPLFLFKTIHVCENCCLKYLEFSTVLLRLGSDIKKLVSSDSVSSIYLHEDKYIHNIIHNSSTNDITNKIKYELKDDNILK